MSTRGLESPELRVGRADVRVPLQAYRLALPLVVEANGALCHGLFAMNATWVGLANRRLEENSSLPAQLAGCTSLSAMLHVYGGYCRRAIEQYQAALGAFQQIGFDLLSENPVAGVVRVKLAGSQQQENARADRATRGSSP